MTITTKDVFDYIKSVYVPVGSQDLVEYFHINKEDAEALLQCTCNQFPPPTPNYDIDEENESSSPEYLVKVTSETGTYCYFHRITTWGDANRARDIINEQFIHLAVKNDLAKNQIIRLQSEVHESQKQFEEKLNSFYANILTIMSILISFFSLIIINANLLADTKFSGWVDLLKIFIVVDFPMVICLVIFVLLVRVVLVNPLIKNKRKENRKLH